MYINNRPFIGGKFIQIKKEKSQKKISPLGKHIKLPDLYICDETEIKLAINSSIKTLKSENWLLSPFQTKKCILNKLIEKMKKSIDLLAKIDCLETGRSFFELKNDSIPKAIQLIEWFNEAFDKINDNAFTVPSNINGLTLKTPFGLVLCITPWNDPLVPSLWKIIPALLMGNSVIVKPAEQSSFSILKIAEYLRDSGLPDGALNILTGTGEITGKKLVEATQIDAIFFTGSTDVGKEIISNCCKSKIKKLNLECGGKSAVLVTNRYALFKKAVLLVCKNIFYNQGQICSAPSRLLIPNSKVNYCKQIIKSCINQYAPGDPLISKIGIIVEEGKCKQIKKCIQNEKNKKTFFIEAKKNKYQKTAKNGISPIAFFEPKRKSQVWKEEIFGPVLCVKSYKSLKSAIDYINDSDYGLAAAIFSNNLDEVKALSQKIHAGLIHINNYGEDDNRFPFGGIKNSGFGKSKSALSFDEATYKKVICY